MHERVSPGQKGREYQYFGDASEVIKCCFCDSDIANVFFFKLRSLSNMNPEVFHLTDSFK